MTNASLQFTVALLLCGSMAAKSIGRPVETDSSDYSSDSSSSYDEGEYVVDSHSVSSIVQKLRVPLMRAAARAKMFVVGKPADDQRLKNIIDVPINCPPGWKIGYDEECHPDFDAEFESMRIESKPGGANVIDPPPNCPEGWLPGEDGECHPIFEDVGALRTSKGRNVVDPPINCPEGWLPGEDGECHPIFEIKEKNPNASKRKSDGRNVIDPPPNCPEGWLPGEDGECHPIFEDVGALRTSKSRNVVDPPINCPEGWLPGEDGECHPIFEMKEKSPNASRRTSDGRNVIDPPPNCPEGWLPGEDGECHPPFEVAASTSRQPK